MSENVGTLTVIVRETCRVIVVVVVMEKGMLRPRQDQETETLPIRVFSRIRLKVIPKEIG
jgi:hypothetical protein